MVFGSIFAPNAQLMVHFLSKFTTFGKIFTRNPEGTTFGIPTRFTEKSERTERTTFGFILKQNLCNVVQSANMVQSPNMV
jgi:hypothetical protein